MTIATIFAQVSCSDLAASIAVRKAVRKAALAPTMPGLAEWQFIKSAAVQLFEAREHAGHSTLTLGVLPLEPERERFWQPDCRPARSKRQLISTSCG